MGRMVRYYNINTVTGNTTLICKYYHRATTRSNCKGHASSNQIYHLIIQLTTLTFKWSNWTINGLGEKDNFAFAYFPCMNLCWSLKSIGMNGLTEMNLRCINKAVVRASSTDCITGHGTCAPYHAGVHKTLFVITNCNWGTHFFLPSCFLIIRETKILWGKWTASIHFLSLMMPQIYKNIPWFVMGSSFADQSPPDLNDSHGCLIW